MDALAASGESVSLLGHVIEAGDEQRVVYDNHLDLRLERLTMRRRVAILISGRGSNMTALIEAARATDFPAEIAVVVPTRTMPRASPRPARRIFRRGDRKPAVRQGPRRLREGAADRAGSAQCRPGLPCGLHAAVHDRVRAALARAHAEHPPLAAAVRFPASIRTDRRCRPA